MTRKNAGLLDDIGMRMNYHISTEEFALVWYSCSTPMEVAEQLGLPYGPMMMRVSRYRRAGIRLKRIPRKNERRADMEGINKSIIIVNTFSESNLQAVAAPAQVERVLVLANERTTTPPARGLSVRIHLLDGTADGLHIIERARSTIQAFACPRGRFRDVKSRPEFQKPGVYLLIGQQEAEGRRRLYVGEGDPALHRLENHYCKKDFWTCLFLFISKNDCLHKAHLQFLESRMMALAKLGSRCKLDNGNTPQPPSLSDVDLAEGKAFLDEALLLTRLSGLSVFEQGPSVLRQDDGLVGQEMTAHGPEALGEADSGTG